MATNYSQGISLDKALQRKAMGFPEWKYFEKRMRSVHQVRLSLNLPLLHEEGKEKVFQNALSVNKDVPKRIMYIHIPFCTNFCKFCGYTKLLTRSDTLIEEYVKSVISQIQLIAKTPWASIQPIEAIHFGGGTPTALLYQNIVKICKAVHQAFVVGKDAEITVESTFDCLIPEDVPILIDAGINRISLGVQTFDVDLRRNMGRVTTFEEVLQKLNAISTIGLKSIAIDLLYNLPGQTLEKWEKDFEILPNVPVQACSVYPLVIPESSQLHKDIQDNKEQPQGDIEAEYRFFSCSDGMLVDKMKWKRFSPVQYGNDNFDSSTYVRARRLGYDSIGIGASAVGYIGNVCYVNSLNVSDYILDQKNNTIEHMNVYNLPPNYAQVKDCYRLSETESAQKTKILALLPEMEVILEKLSRLGLIKLIPKSDILSLTHAGRFWYGNISAIISELIKMRTHESDKGSV